MRPGCRAKTRPEALNEGIILKNGFPRVAALLLILALAGYFKFIQMGDNRGRSGPINVRATRPIIPDSDSIHGIAVDHEKAPLSSWLNNERRIAETYLRGARVSLLILPVQGDKNAFDPVERSLIARLLGDNIAQLGPNYVANANAVLQFLGTHRSTYSAADIRRLATIVRAEKILFLWAEHDRINQWNLTATLKTSDDASLDESRTWTNLRFSDSLTPSASFKEILQEVAEFATDQRPVTAFIHPEFDESKFVFPESLELLVKNSSKSPLHAAAYLQLIGMLHPRGDFNEIRDHLFERSLVQLENVSPEAPFYRYFKARAYAYLDRRPAAVAVLAQPIDRHEEALLAALNGNLPDLQSYVEGGETSVLRFMALKDLQKIGYWYSAKIDSDELEQFALDHPVWAPFLFRSFRDYEEWANYTAATLKFGLEGLLPAEVTSLENHYAKQTVVGDFPDELDLTRLLWKHIEALEKKTVTAWASEPGARSIVSTIDVLELAKTTSVANHLREVEEDLTKRVIPHAAIDQLSRFESIYRDHPAVTLLRGRALKAMAEKSTGAERGNFLTASNDAFSNGFAWTGRLTEDAVSVARAYSRFSRLPQRSIPVAYSRFSLYSRRYFEWPRSSGWYRRFPDHEVKEDALQSCIDYVSTQFECLKYQIEVNSRDSDSPDLNCWRCTLVAIWDTQNATSTPSKSLVHRMTKMLKFEN